MNSNSVRDLLCIVFGLLCAPICVQAQEQAEDPRETTYKASSISKAPVSDRVLEVRSPTPVEFRLANGLTVLVVEDHRTPVIRAELHVNGAGALFEPAHRHGLARLVVNMLLQGTELRSRRQLTEDIDRLGLVLFSSAQTGSAEAAIRASGLSDEFEQWFRLVAEVVLHASFPGDELAKLRQRRDAQQQRDAASPSVVAEQQFRRMIRGDAPNVTIPTGSKPCSDCTIDILRQWYSERFAPQNAVLGIAGDIRPARALRATRHAFGPWRKTGFQPEALPDSPVRSSMASVCLIDRPDSVQTTLLVGGLAAGRMGEDYFPMLVLNHVLGEGPSSRLRMRLRDERGLAYTVGSSFSVHPHPSVWQASADVRTESAGEALSLMLAEIDHISRGDISEQETQKSKRSIAAALAFSLEDPVAPLTLALSSRRFGLPAAERNTFTQRIASVTAFDVRRVARKYLDRATLQVIAVGDARPIRPVVQKWVPLQQIHLVQ